MTRTTFPFAPGDVFFCRGKGGLDRVINAVQARRSRDGDTRCSHTGVVIGPGARTLETTPWRTGFLDLGADYAGSDLVVLRLDGMTPERAYTGLCAVRDQIGRIYPYLRLLCHLFGVAGLVKTQAMECCVLAAHFLRGAGVSLKDGNLWGYDTETLHDELRARPDCRVVLEGSQRVLGYIFD